MQLASIPGRMLVLLVLVAVVLGDSCYKHDNDRDECISHKDNSDDASDGGGCRWCTVRDEHSSHSSRRHACNSVSYMNAFEFERNYWVCEGYSFDEREPTSRDTVRDRTSLAHTCMGRVTETACSESGATDMRGESCFWCVDPAVDGAFMCATKRYKAVMSFAFPGVDLKCQAPSYRGDEAEGDGVTGETGEGENTAIRSKEGAAKEDGAGISPTGTDGAAKENDGEKGHTVRRRIEDVDYGDEETGAKEGDGESGANVGEHAGLDHSGESPSKGKPPLPPRMLKRKPSADGRPAGDAGSHESSMDDHAKPARSELTSVHGDMRRDNAGVVVAKGKEHIEKLTPVKVPDGDSHVPEVAPAASRRHKLTRVDALGSQDELDRAAPLHKLVPDELDHAAPLHKLVSVIPPRAKSPAQSSTPAPAPAPATTSIETKTVVKQTPYGPETHTITTTITKKIVDDDGAGPISGDRDKGVDKPEEAATITLGSAPDTKSERREPSTPTFGNGVMPKLGGSEAPGRAPARERLGDEKSDHSASEVRPALVRPSGRRDDEVQQHVGPLMMGPNPMSGFPAVLPIPEVEAAASACAVVKGHPEFIHGTMGGDKGREGQVKVVNLVFGLLDYIEDRVSEAVSLGNKEVDAGFLSEANRKLLQVSIETKNLDSSVRGKTKLPFLKDWRRFFNEVKEARGRVGVEDVSFELEAHEMMYCQKSAKAPDGDGGVTPGRPDVTPGVDVRLDEKGHGPAGFATMPLLGGDLVDDALTDEDRAMLHDESLNDDNFQLGDHIYKLATFGS